MTELATIGPSYGALAVRADQHGWTPEQHAALAQIGIDRAPPGDQTVFMHVCQRTGLDPFSRQIYMIERGGKWTIQTGIDGFRVIAERRPEYAGQTEPQWCGEDGEWRNVWLDRQKPPAAARVGVLRTDWAQPAWGVVHFAEFTAGNSMWKAKAAHMIAKVAEATALRKAFPNDLAGLLTPEETDRDDRGPAPVQHRSAAPESVPVDELTGGAAAPKQATSDRMRPDQQKQLLGLIRTAELEDRWGWVSDTLGRQVTSYGQITGADADKLIGRLTALDADPNGATAGG